MRNGKVTVCEAFDGDVTVVYQGQTFRYRVLAGGEPPIPLNDEKSTHATIQRCKIVGQPGRWHFRIGLTYLLGMQSYIYLMNRYINIK